MTHERRLLNGCRVVKSGVIAGLFFLRAKKIPSFFIPGLLNQRFLHPLTQTLRG